MGNNSAGRGSGGNDGQTDQGRGSSLHFPFTKGGRNTGKVGGSGSKQANSNTEDGNKRQANDPRLA